MDAIARYLHALADPAARVDQAQLEKLQKQLETARDPLKRVKLRVELLRAQKGDLAPLEEAFIEALPAWIRSEGLSPAEARAALRAEGVPRAVLDKALKSRRKRRSRPRKTSPRAGRDAVDAALEAQRGAFTLKELATASGASYQLVRKFVRERLQAQQVKELGPDPAYQGRGKPPVRYQKRT